MRAVGRAAALGKLTPSWVPLPTAFACRPGKCLALFCFPSPSSAGSSSCSGYWNISDKSSLIACRPTHTPWCCAGCAWVAYVVARPCTGLPVMEQRLESAGSAAVAAEPVGLLLAKKSELWSKEHVFQWNYLTLSALSRDDSVSHPSRDYALAVFKYKVHLANYRWNQKRWSERKALQISEVMCPAWWRNRFFSSGR